MFSTLLIHSKLWRGTEGWQRRCRSRVVGWKPVTGVRWLGDQQRRTGCCCGVRGWLQGGGGAEEMAAGAEDGRRRRSVGSAAGVAFGAGCRSSGDRRGCSRVLASAAEARVVAQASDGSSGGRFAGGDEAEASCCGRRSEALQASRTATSGGRAAVARKRAERRAAAGVAQRRCKRRWPAAATAGVAGRAARGLGDRLGLLASRARAEGGTAAVAALGRAAGGRSEEGARSGGGRQQRRRVFRSCGEGVGDRLLLLPFLFGFFLFFLFLSLSLPSLARHLSLSLYPFD